MAIRSEPRTLGGLPVQIDYTARDYTSIRNELIRHIDSIMPNWTDRSNADIGISMLEAMSYLGDILSYNLDRVHNESYLATAQTQQSVNYLLRLIGYNMSPATPATVSMVIVTNQNNVLLPSGFTVKTSDDGTQLKYQLTEDVTLANAGTYAVSYDVDDAIRIYNEPNVITDDRLVFVAGQSITEQLATSTGLADQAYITSSSPICISSDASAPVRVFVGSVEWTAKTSFVGSEANSTVFTYRLLSDESLLIKFGDGVIGAIPAIGETITATYRINGGEITNRAGVGTITSFDTIQGVSSVYNISQPSGGTDKETLDHAKKHGPLSLRALDRCVTLEDFEIMAVQTPGGGIRSARAVRGDSAIDVDVYVATEGSNPIPSGFWYSDINNGYGVVGAVGRWLLQKKPVPTKLRVFAPTLVEVLLKAKIYVYANVLRTTAEEEVDLALQRLFSTTTDEFGQGLPLSAVHQAIENTRGVDYVDITEMHKIPNMRLINGSQSAFDTALVSFIEYGQDMTSQSFEILWLSDSTFKLIGSVFGEILNNLGEIHIFNINENSEVLLYPSEDVNSPEQIFQFSFNITFPQDRPSRGNIWSFSVDSYSGNIVCQDHEILSSPLQSNLRLDPTKIQLTFLGGI